MYNIFNTKGEFIQSVGWKPQIGQVFGSYSVVQLHETSFTAIARKNTNKEAV